jgi:hypothetical protein
MWGRHVLSEVQLERLHFLAIKAHSGAKYIVGCNGRLQKATKCSVAAAAVIFRVIVTSDDLTLFTLTRMSVILPL